MKQLGRQIRRTNKAALFQYGREQLWIPLRALTFSEGSYHAPEWAIEAGKKFNKK